MILPHPSQPPISNLKTKPNKNLSLSSSHIQFGPGTSSSPPHFGHAPPPLSSSSCFFPPLWYPLTLQPLPLQQTSPLNFCLGLLLYLHPLFNCDKGWSHCGIEVWEALTIVVANIKCDVDLFLCVKSHSNKKTQANKNCPGIENQQPVSQWITSCDPSSPTFLDRSASIPSI